jgi:hypothetical protein
MDHERRGLRQNAERQCHRLDAIDRHRGGDHLVAEHELALHVGRPGELVEWNVVLRVVPQLRSRGRRAIGASAFPAPRPRTALG